MIPLLEILPNGEGTRVRRDRLEVLGALMQAPGVDPLFREEVIRVPPRHPVFWWQCEVEACECVARDAGFCTEHSQQWAHQRGHLARARFAETAEPVETSVGVEVHQCRVCRHRPASARSHGLCDRHRTMWLRAGRPLVEEWAARQGPFRSFGRCQVSACPELAQSPLGLCVAHRSRYPRDGSPGNAHLPTGWWRRLEPQGLPVPVFADDEVAFRRWCTTAGAVQRAGVVNLLGLQPLVRAEVQWVLFAHTQQRNAPRWTLSSLQHLVELCRAKQVASLFDLAPAAGGTPHLEGHADTRVRMVLREAVDGLRTIYYSPADTRDAGFLETDHFGRRFPDSRSFFDLSAVTQRWLRDLLWDHLAGLLQSPRCPRSRGPFDNYRRAVVALSAFLEVDAPDGGHDPAALGEEHAQRFVADQRHRARHGLASLGLHRSDGKPSTVTDITCRATFNHVRALAHRALETGATEQIGLPRTFVTALPVGGADPKRSRSPFSDELARALADEANLCRLAEVHDPNDRGLRDVWETIVLTGRRCSEVLGLRLDCIGRYRGLAMLWHDQTKVGRYDQAIRIPEHLYTRLDARRAITLARFEDRYGRPPASQERAAMALFPTHIRNQQFDRRLSYTTFNSAFRAWVDSLDVGPAVPHQARHTLATNLLRAGATLAHIRRYLGQVSDRMAEHYAHVAHSDLEDVLNAVWVAGPGSPAPGTVLSGEHPLSKDEALALALDLSRRSTPTEGGFCTFQPVVSGGACPWNLDCANCDKFVLSGADLLYWRRKQEQWRTIAERAPDDATADYLHQVFEPTARAIDGLESALAGLGLLDEALALDLRRPQDYFHRLWSTGFRAAELGQIDPARARDDAKMTDPV